jgi:transcriptional antiterminator RfaH
MAEERQGRWTLIQTKPRQEDYAQENVERQGLRTFLPKFLPDRLPTHGKKPKPEPLFRSYLFVEIYESWYFLKNTFGVARPVLWQGMPAIVPISVINEIRARQSKSGLVKLPKSRFEENQEVRVRAGVASKPAIYFKDAIGLYQGMTNEQRCKVLFGTIFVTIPTNLLEAVI